MKKQRFALLILLFLLISCAPQVEVGSEIPDEEPVTEQQPIEESNTPADESEPFVPEPTRIISRDDIAQDGSEQKSDPTTVDLGSLVTPQPEEESEPIVQPAPGSPNPAADLLNRVQIDLSNKLDVDMSQIETLSVEEVQWRDSSLGCPQPDMSYLQVITSGFRIKLSVDGETYHYHSRDTSNFVLCDNPKEPASGEPPSNGLGDT